MALNEFISTVKNDGISAKNKFAMMINFPFHSSIGDSRKALLYCHSVALPEESIGTEPNRITGEVRNVGYEKIYDKISASFYIDNDYKIKKLFDDWMRLTYDPYSRRFNYLKNYTTDINIYVMNRQEQEVYVVTCYDAWVQSMGAVELDYAGSTEVSTLSVNFEYKYLITSNIIPLKNGEVPKSIGNRVKVIRDNLNTLFPPINRRSQNSLDNRTLELLSSNKIINDINFREEYNRRNSEFSDFSIPDVIKDKVKEITNE